VLKKPSLLKNGSSDTSHDTLALGYTGASKSEPKALLSSNRRAPVMNSRSLNDISCSTNTPTERASTVVSLASVLAAPVMVPDPAGRPRPMANTPEARSR
jgi:hypothetical protein